MSALATATETYSRNNPSPRYRELTSLYAQMHVGGLPDQNIKAQVELMALTPEGAPILAEEIEVQVQGGGEINRLKLSADPAVNGRYLGKLAPKTPGDYRVIYVPSGKGEPVEARLRVETSSAELRQPNVNRDALRLLAKEGGGEMLELHELASIKDRFKGNSRFTEMHSEKTLWDNGWLLGLFLGLAAAFVAQFSARTYGCHTTHGVMAA